MRNAKIGDLYCVKAVPYLQLQYLGKHPLMGECVAVISLKEKTKPSHSTKLVFYPLRLNIRNGNLEYVRTDNPVTGIPRCIRRPKMVKNGSVHSWFIDDGHSTRTTDDLKDDELRIPVGVVTSHDVLLEWLDGGWDYMLGAFE